MKRSLSIILSACLCITLLSGCNKTETIGSSGTDSTFVDTGQIKYVMPIAYNTTDKSSERLQKFGELSERDFNGKLYPYSYYLYVNNQAERNVYKALYEGIYSFKSSVDLSAYNITTDSVMTIIQAMQLDNPDFYYIDTSKIAINTKPQTSDTLYVDTVGFEYAFTKNEVAQHTTQLSEMVEIIKAAIPDTMSAYDKYVYLNDFIVLNTIYADAPTYPGDHIGAFLEGETQCLGFAKAYIYLCRELGLPCALATGSFGLSHAWNVIPYEDGWMTVDVGMNNVDSDIKDWVQHAYMGYTEQTMTETLGYAFDRSIYNAPVADKGISFSDKLGELYKVSTTDTTLATEQIADMIVRAKTDGRNYVEVTALTETIYPVLRDTLLTTDKLYIYDILDKAALKCPNIDTERVGVVPLTGTHTVVLYVFDKD